MRHIGYLISCETSPFGWGANIQMWPNNEAVRSPFFSIFTRRALVGIRVLVFFFLFAPNNGTIERGARRSASLFVCLEKV